MKLKLSISIILVFFMLFSQSVYAIGKKSNVVTITDETQNEETAPEKLVTKISYDDVIKKAIEHSYDLKISDYNVLIAKQGVRGARSEYFPKLNFSAATEYTKNFRDVKESTIMSVGDAFINPYTRYQSVMGINVMYNLFDFGVRGGNLKIEKENTAIKELELKDVEQELYLTILDIYTKILVSSKQLSINKEILALEEKNLEYKDRLYNAKEISKTELNDAKTHVSIAKNKISDLQTIMSESINWLSFYTGEKYDLNNLTVEDLKKSNFDTSANVDYTKSIKWKIYEKQIKKKELELGVVKRYNYPKINLYGRYYLYGSNFSSYNKALSDIEPSNISVGAALNMPLFDGFKNNANIKKTALELEQLYVERDKTIAQYMTKLAVMRSNSMFLEEQINENNQIIKELSAKEKSVDRLLSKKLISPIELNDTKVELYNQKIEYEKNLTTQNAIIRGLEILTKEYT